MPEISLEELIEEQEFASLLASHASLLRCLGSRLTGASLKSWSKHDYFTLIHESNVLESFLDDYGARFNQAFAFTRELTASVRWIALAGYSLRHLKGRMRSYKVANWFEADLAEQVGASLESSSLTIQSWAESLLVEFDRECCTLGLAAPEGLAVKIEAPASDVRRRLPRNLGQVDLINEDQKIAGVASRYIETCASFSEIGVRVLEDVDERAKFFRRHCTEANIRVLEAEVHNLQSTYDTHIQNTVLESKDERLLGLRGFVSVALHALEASLYLAHFLERHEDEIRGESESSRRIREIVDAPRLKEIVVNELFVVANGVLQAGLVLAEALVPTYTNVCEMQLELVEGTTLHARPAALIVGIVNHHGTPVELEVAGQRCNASSILELLVAVGSNPHERVFTFHGDERPLADIQLLFESRMGEDGLESLPSELAYLRTR